MNDRHLPLIYTIIVSTDVSYTTVVQTVWTIINFEPVKHLFHVTNWLGNQSEKKKKKKKKKKEKLNHTIQDIFFSVVCDNY